LIRVTGDCFLADRVLFRFDAVDPRVVVFFFFAATFGFAATRGPPVRLALVAEVLPAARLEVDFLRAFPPDDFDRVAIFVSSEGRYAQSCARFARNAEPVDIGAIGGDAPQRRKITRSLRIATVVGDRAVCVPPSSWVSRRTANVIRRTARRSRRVAKPARDLTSLAARDCARRARVRGEIFRVSAQRARNSSA
jgi:hypothetical protein